MFMADPIGIYLQCLIFFRYQRAEYIHHIFDQLGKGDFLIYQIDLPAFNLGHIQNLIDQIQQMAAGGVDLCKAVLYFIW